MTDLRTGLVEAMAQDMANTLANMAHNRGWPMESPSEYLFIASALSERAVDTALGFLTDNAEAWGTAAHFKVRGNVIQGHSLEPLDLIAALSDGRDTGEKP